MQVVYLRINGYYRFRERLFARLYELDIRVYYFLLASKGRHLTKYHEP